MGDGVHIDVPVCKDSKLSFHKHGVVVYFLLVEFCIEIKALTTTFALSFYTIYTYTYPCSLARVRAYTPVETARFMCMQPCHARACAHAQRMRTHTHTHEHQRCGRKGKANAQCSGAACRTPAGSRYAPVRSKAKPASQVGIL